MKARPRIETERLDLRPFDLSDAADVQQLANDPRIADVTQNIPHPYEDGMAEEWISTHQSAYESGKRVQFAIQLKSTCEFLGCISLNDIGTDLKIRLVNFLDDIGPGEHQVFVTAFQIKTTKIVWA